MLRRYPKKTSQLVHVLRSILLKIAKILWAADEAVLKTVHKMKKSMPMIQIKK
jgi:hypothetical protein